ncbi:hypothetical protein ACHAXM_008290 [Skeletonema potamos]|jgi:hypothetical protein
MRILLKAAIAVAVMPSGRVMADERHVSYLDSTLLFPDADFRVHIDASVQSSSDAPNNRLSYSGKVFGQASVYPAFIQKLQQATGKIVNLPEGCSFHDVQVQTLYLTESSARHTDTRIRGKGDNIKLIPLNESDGSLTAFYVQESTVDAYFETDDDELCIPYAEGSAVYFNGGLPHHTILKSGAVKLVGPFLFSSLESVGMDTKAGKVLKLLMLRPLHHQRQRPERCAGSKALKVSNETCVKICIKRMSQMLSMDGVSDNKSK